MGMGQFQPEGYTRGIENMFPVALVPAESGNYKGKQSQHHGYGNITGKICSARRNGNQTKHIVDPYKKEHGKQDRAYNVHILGQWKA